MATGKRGAQPKLNATNLKTALWNTLNEVKSGTMECGQADAVASQAREILRTTKVQMQISAYSGHTLPTEVLRFNDGK